MSCFKLQKLKLSLFLVKSFILCSLNLSAQNSTYHNSEVSNQTTFPAKRINTGNFSFPNGKMKCLVMSFDDGPEHDRILLQKLNKAGIVGTFHFNSGRLGQKAKWLSSELGYDVHFVTKAEVSKIYKGHEVASHTSNHYGLKGQQDSLVKVEVSSDFKKLNDLIGNTDHYPVQGLAYPFGGYDANTIKVLKGLGVKYARTTASTHDFEIPTSNFLALNPTCHLNDALELGAYFVKSKSEEIQLLNIWGHSYEFHKNWKLADSICNIVGNNENIWYAQTIELIDYLTAIKELKYEDGSVYNPSKETSVWVKSKKRVFEKLLPGKSIEVDFQSSYIEVKKLDYLYPPKSTVIQYHGDWTKNHYQERIEGFKKAPLHFGEVVFLGNSITEQGGDWGEKLGLQNVRNRGIAGDVTDGVLKRINEVTYYKPKAIFLLIGINDLFNLHYQEQIPSSEYVANNILKITKIIHQQSPQTKIYVQTVLPTSKEFMKGHINKVNSLLKFNERTSDYQLINLYKEFVGNNGLLKEHLSTDGTHLNDEGYKLWVATIKPMINNPRTETK